MKSNKSVQLSEKHSEKLVLAINECNEPCLTEFRPCRFDLSLDNDVGSVSSSTSAVRYSSSSDGVLLSFADCAKDCKSGYNDRRRYRLQAKKRPIL